MEGNMPKLTRKRAILAKIESTYGTDSVPTGAANAILVRNIEVTPIAAEVVGRDVIRPYMGESEQLIANRRVELSFEVEVAGSGTAGTAPAYGPLLRACGLTETVLAAAHTGTAQAGGAATITLAAGASAVDNVYVGLQVRITAGTGSGQAATIVGYNGTSKVAVVSTNWATPPNGTSTYSVDPGVTYRPNSGPFESVTIYVNVDGTQHRVTGGRGSFEYNVTAKQIPEYRFRFVGVYNTVTDVALPTAVYTAFQTPLVANNSNTTGFSFLSASGIVLESLQFNLGNSVDFRALIGTEYTQITDRRVSGQITYEAPDALSTLDIFAAAANTSIGALTLTHGTSAGNRVTLYSNRVDVGNPNYADSNGVVMISCPVVFIPNNGNDEFVITVT
jgi:hypothetical protein